MTQSTINPLVSIVIPSYNHSKFINECIESVINQDYQNIELIIIDDGSQDESIEIINKMISKCKERFVRFEFRHRSNKGLCATLNEALQWCNGEYFSAIASDDIILPFKTTLQVETLEYKPEIIATFGSAVRIDSEGKKIDNIISPNKTHDFKEVFLKEVEILSPTQMIRTSAIRKVGGYPEGILIEDWYMWLKLSQLGNLYTTDKVLSYYRVHDKNTSKRIHEIQEARFDIINLFKDSPYYNQALKRLRWFNELELLVNVNQGKLKRFIKMLLIDPNRTRKQVLKKLLKFNK